MKTFLLFVALFVSLANAFAPSGVVLRTETALMGYIPDGMTAEQWKKVQAKEKAEKAKKNFGAFGPQSFKSRSLQSFQKEMEQGKAGHLMPVFNAKEKIKVGKLRQEDVPYMQRGGSWDNSDVKTAKRVKWNEDDKKYNAASKPGWKGVDWSGKGPRQSPMAKRNQQQPPKPATKKLFGMF